MLLEGVRVVDLTTVVMGPLATRMLADMGADVIWVESPAGDVLRDYEPMRSAKMSAFSMSMSRNKRSVMLDLKTETGAQAVRDLIATADVFVTNLRRKAIDRLGLDERHVRELRPDIVYCTANGFGSGGPDADKTGLLIFGAGYGFEVLDRAAWLQHCRVHYWGDIDTHGFAILDQLRAHLPDARSIMMDRSTLLAFEAHWGVEQRPTRRDLERLNADERALYDDLRDNRIRPKLRLEQEHIGFGWVERALAELESMPRRP